MHLIADTTSSFKAIAKIEMQIRLKRSDFSTSRLITATAQDVVETILHPTFNRQLIAALNRTTTARFRLDHSRYGWMTANDMQIMNAIATPIGGVRDHEAAASNDGVYGPDYNNDLGMYQPNRVEYYLIGTCLGLVFVLVVTLVLHFRLRAIHANLEKDKTSGGSLRNMWSRFRAKIGGAWEEGMVNGGGKVMGRRRKTSFVPNSEEVELAALLGSREKDDEDA